MRGTPFPIVDFSKGLWLPDNDGATEQANDLNGYALEALNVRPSPDGRFLHRRGGHTSFASLAAVGTSLHGLSATATKYLIVAANSHLYKVTSAGTVTDISDAAPYASDRWDFIEAPTSGGQGPLYMMNGTDGARYWSGSGNVASWTAASGTFPFGTGAGGDLCIFHANRVWVSARTSSRVYFSDIGDPRAWPDANVVDFDPSDGDAITGFGKVGPYLLVFKRHKTFVVYDDATGANRRISDSVGCRYSRTIAETPAGTVFLNDPGVYITDGQGVTHISDAVDAVSSPSSTVSPAGAYFDSHYYVVGDGYLLDYDLKLKSWWRHSSTVFVNQFAKLDFSTGERLYSVDASASRINRLLDDSVYQDNGGSLTSTWRSGWMSFGSPGSRHRCRGVRVSGRGTVTATVKAGVPPTGSVSVGKSLTLGSTVGDRSTFYTPTGTVAPYWSFQVSGAGNEAVEVEQIIPYMQARKD